jgi:hypothetical protein
MKTPLRTGILLISALSLPAQAHAWEYPPCKVDGGVRIYLKVQLGNAALPLAPWYLYFPAEAYQQPIGPAGYYPNWPPAPTPAAALAYPTPRPPFSMSDGPPSALQRTAYQAPAYWYGQ